MTIKISEFDIQYAYWLEDMHDAFWRRVDACINIALIVLGTSVAASLSLDFAIGLSVALLAAINVVVQPLKKSIHARSQASKISKLLDSKHSMNADVLSEKFEEISEHSSDELGMLTSLAYNQAAIILKKRPAKKYSLLNKMAGHFIGNLPASKP